VKPAQASQARAIRLDEIADVAFAPALKRGDAGLNGRPAVILMVQKQPGADTLALTAQVDAAFAALAKTIPPGMELPRTTMRQASFIEASIKNINSKLVTASVLVAVILFLFLGNLRTTFISLTAIPISIAITALIFWRFGLSINTMTLGGLAIAIGELVDDAVVGVENVSRRFRLAKQNGINVPTAQLIREATLEVRSAIVYATIIIVLVFVPLFALPGLEGRLFVPLGVAYIVSILASMIVSITLTPVLAYYLLPRMKSLDHPEPWLVRMLKRGYARALAFVLDHSALAIAAALIATIAAAATVPFFARTFLPPFNEGAVVIGIRLMPGSTLSESVAVGQAAERLLVKIPEVANVGRRTGRAELDEHAEGVHVTELDVRLKPRRELKRSMADIEADIRRALTPLPGNIAMGGPISHRIDHMLSGVAAQIAIKIFGDDLDVLRGEAERLRAALVNVRGVVDLNVERQVLTPQLRVELDYPSLARYGVAPGALLNELQILTEGKPLSQVVEGARRFDLVLRLPDAARTPQALRNMLIDTPVGKVPLYKLANVVESDGPNEVRRDDGRRRIVLSASAQGRPLSEVVADIRGVLAAQPLPQGTFVTMGGQFDAQEKSSRLIAGLSLISFVLVFLVLYARYQSAALAGLIMGNIPLALVGSVIGLWLSAQPLSIAAIIGFITLAGISVRNGILKVSHYVNLCAREGHTFGKPMLVQGSLDRLTPVVMTALVAAFALAPLLFEADQPGTEILHPVAVVIFSGLISATLLDSFITPALVWKFGRKPIEQLANQKRTETF
jgi:heavy-metal exporter, HME family